MPTFSLRRLALLLALLCTTLLHAEDVTVDCDVDPPPPGTFSSIQAALNSLSGEQGHTINVSGTCNERITVRFWEFLTIQGPPDGMAIIDGGPTDDPTIGPTINLQRAREITLRRLHVRNGGAGVVAFGSSYTLAAMIIEGSRGVCVNAGPDSRVEIGSAPIAGVPTFVTIRNCGAPGLDVNRGIAIVNGALIENNGGNSTGGQVFLRPNGVLVGSGVATLNNVTVRNNVGSGIGSINRSHVFINGGVIENHPTYGVSAESTSFVGLGGTIRNNGTVGALYGGGVSAIHNSTLRGGAVIENNVGPGVLVDSGSTMGAGNLTVTGNTADGIRLINGAILEFFVSPAPPSPVRTFSGNGGNDVSCDNTTIVFGDTVSGIKTNCSFKKGK